LGSNGETLSDREMIEQHIERIDIKPSAIEIRLAGATGEDQLPTIVTVPWTGTTTPDVKGVLHSPMATTPTMSPENRDVLLTAIAKARDWVDDLVEGRAATFAEIAKREGKVERHIRFLAPLAFVSPRIVSAIGERTVPDLKVTELAKAAAGHSWVGQERQVGIPRRGAAGHSNS
jgi:site-specific DNA recombinase